MASATGSTGRKAPQKAAPQEAPEGVREGNRWVGNPPAGDEVADWFKTVKLHDGMEHDEFVGGIVLIPNTDKTKRVNSQGEIVEIERLVWTPYVKVETRIDYFWKLCEKNGWEGVIEPIGTQSMTALHRGFSRLAFKDARGAEVSFVVCTMRAAAYLSDVRAGHRGRCALDPAPGTKQVKVLGKFGPDENALMKAETGAVGRALGMAGILVIPGTGVATAEDMQDALGSTGVVAETEPQLPGDGKAPAVDIRERIAELRQQVESDAPGKMDELEEWAKGRGIDVNDLRDAQLRPVLRKLEQALSAS